MKRIDEIKHIEFLDPLDIQARTGEISLLTDGWMAGEGVPPTKEFLKWLADSFASFYPGDLPLPCIYPTLDGGISLEWSNAKVEISLLIPPDHKKCLLSILVIPEEKYEEKSIELSAEDGRNSLFNAIRTLVVEAGK
jgi:hypothetical protein